MSEEAFYYSYYVDLVTLHAPWVDVLTRDNRTEYPDSINALSRFNIWQGKTAVHGRSFC